MEWKELDIARFNVESDSKSRGDRRNTHLSHFNFFFFFLHFVTELSIDLAFVICNVEVFIYLQNKLPTYFWLMGLFFYPKLEILTVTVPGYLTHFQNNLRPTEIFVSYVNSVLNSICILS